MSNYFIIARVLALGALLAAPFGAAADTNLLLILDGSNSMWGQIDGKPKIEIARSVLGEVLDELPDNVNPGLMVYGHRVKGDCDDVELIAGFDEGDRGRIKAAVSGLSPRGKTPIAASLAKSREAFEGREEDANAVVLISDGIETCAADPCKAAAELVGLSVNVRIHTVGFNVDAEAATQLQCIADAGNGQYFDAADASGLQAALSQARAAVVEAPPPPKPAPAPKTEPEPTVVFQDSFDGEFLSEQWSVNNPDPEGFLVEDGHLLLIDTGAGYLGDPDVTNLIRLTGFEIPKGDWTASATLAFPMQTTREVASLSVFDNPTSYISADLYSSGDKYRGWNLTLRIRKVSGDNVSQFTQSVAALGCNVCGTDRQFDDFTATVSQPLTLQLIKEGRSLYARAKQAGSDARWVETEKVSTLRLRGDLTINLAEYEKTAGETFAVIDNIKVEAPPK